MNPIPSGKFYEDLELGLIIHHQTTRTLTEADNVFFTTMTMNPQPLHLDREYAARTEFKQPLVNSMLTLSLLVGLSVPELTMGTLVANLGFEKIEFPKPVFHGDTLRAESEVLSKRLSKSRPNAGVVNVEHRAINQRHEIVCRCVRTVLIQRRTNRETEAPS
jgi:acyl dehydratase